MGCFESAGGPKMVVGLLNVAARWKGDCWGLWCVMVLCIDLS